MKGFKRLAQCEFLVLVAIAASALTLHVRERVAAPAHPSTHVRMCEPPAVDDEQPARMLPADCDIRATPSPRPSHAIWV